MMAAAPSSYDELLYGRSMSFSLSEAPGGPECSICSEHYDDQDGDLIPRNLSCGHSMCSRCIFRYMQLNGQQVEGGVHMTCPKRCSQPTIIPNGQVTNLPKNYAVVEIVHEKKERSSSFSLVAVTPAIRARSTSVPQQPSMLATPSSSSFASSSTSSSTSNISSSSTDDYKCDVCEVLGATVVCPSCAVCLCLSCSNDIHSRRGYQPHRLISLSEFINTPSEVYSPHSSSLGHRSTSDSDMMDGKQCKQHSGEPLEYACKSCGEIVCRVCQHSEEHKDHDCRLLADVAIEKKEELRQAIADVNQCYARWNDGFDECEELQEHLYDRGRTLESSIKSHFHNIHSSLHAKEEQVLGQVRSEVDSRMKQLKQQAEHLAKVCEVAKDLIKDCEDLLYLSEPSEVLRGVDKTLAHARQYTRSEQFITPMVAVDMETDFSSESDVLQLVEGLGHLQLAPNRVEGVEVKPTGPSASKLQLSWQPPKACPKDQLLYIVQQSSSNNEQFRVVYEGQALECVLDGCTTEEDVVHSFRVAAMNEVGRGPYSMPVTFTQRKASFLWDANLKHPKARLSNNSYTVGIGENATWISVGTNTVLSHGVHYWEVVLDRYGTPSLSRKVIIGVTSSSYHQWHRPHGVMGIKTCPIGPRSWGLACGTAKKLSSGSTFLNSLGRKHNLFKEGDAVGVLLNLDEHKMSFFKNGEPLHIYFNDVYGPVIPAISFCRNKSLTLRFPPFPVKMSSEAGALLSPTLPGQRDGGSPLGQREGRSSPIPIPDNAGSRT